MIDDLVSKGYNVIFTTSFDFMDKTIEAGKKYPNVIFFHCSNYKRNPNYLATSGVDVKAFTVATIALSGALVGLIGSLYLFTELGRLPYELERQTAGYGYLAVLVAWLSTLDLKLVPLSAYVVSALRNAGIAIQVAGLGGK